MWYKVTFDNNKANKAEEWRDEVPATFPTGKWYPTSQGKKVIEFIVVDANNESDALSKAQEEAETLQSI